MDDSRFDAWTRRRFGLAGGGLLAATLGLGLRETRAKKHKPKKCKKRELTCGKKCVKGECCPSDDCGGTCACGRTIDGTTACLGEFEVDCQAATGCTSNGDCFLQERCVPSDCPGKKRNICAPRCLH
jgi:hypothetical protein